MSSYNAIIFLKVLNDSHIKTQGMIGLDKLWDDVRDSGFRFGRNRVYNLQKEPKLYSVRKKPFRVWVTDITEIKATSGKLYFATIKEASIAATLI